ncbi:hypothetical protein ABW20_dc0109703 [Dactylellina cionopaga]|nr:hypothetical protein ABW20_dc0109703 [Dactylellina cionopaga]
MPEEDEPIGNQGQNATEERNAQEAQKSYHSIMTNVEHGSMPTESSDLQVISKNQNQSTKATGTIVDETKTVDFDAFARELTGQVSGANAVIPVEKPNEINESTVSNHQFKQTQAQEEKEVGIYYPSPQERWFSSGGPIYPETPISQERSVVHVQESPTDEIFEDDKFDEGVSSPDAKGEASQSEASNIPDPLVFNTHTWTQAELISLYVIRRWYKNKPAGIRNVLNRCFGISSSSGAYTMQFDEFRKLGKDRNSKIFKEVFIDTQFHDPDAKWEKVKEELGEAAEGAGVILLGREKDEQEFIEAYETIKKQQDQLQMRESLSGFRYAAPVSPLHPQEDSSDSEFETELQNTPSKLPTKSKKRKFANVGGHSRTSRKNSRPQSLTQDILFRYWDDESFGYNSPHLIRAGLFRDISQQVPEPPEMDDPEFQKHAANHINRKKIPTPVISTSNSLMWVLRKAALSRRWFGATNPRIAVIDPAYLKRTFRVSDFIAKLCQNHDMIDAAHRYGGYYNILVWGEITKAAVVNIVDYLDLLRAATVPRHIHIHFRMDIVSRLKIKSAIYGMKFAVTCVEELQRALDDFADIVLGNTPRIGIKEKFVRNIGIDWSLDTRQENQNVSKYFLPIWSPDDAERLMELNPKVDGMIGVGLEEHREGVDQSKVDITMLVEGELRI